MKHGHARQGNISPEWRAWSSMRSRCLLETHPAYDRYGGRGIRVCERWESFEAFLEDMGPRPSADHSLDRKDNDGDYTPENCRWATRKQQTRNRRDNRLLTIEGVTKPAATWAEDVGLNYSILKDRIRSGWEPKRAVFTPRRENDNLRIGQQFESWTIIGPAPRDIRGKKRYRVRCICGNESETQGYDLRKGKTTQCRSCSLRKS